MLTALEIVGTFYAVGTAFAAVWITVAYIGERIADHLDRRYGARA